MGMRWDYHSDYPMDLPTDFQTGYLKGWHSEFPQTVTQMENRKGYQRDSQRVMHSVCLHWGFQRAILKDSSKVNPMGFLTGFLTDSLKGTLTPHRLVTLTVSLTVTHLEYPQMEIPKGFQKDYPKVSHLEI